MTTVLSIAALGRRRCAANPAVNGLHCAPGAVVDFLQPGYTASTGRSRVRPLVSLPREETMPGIICAIRGGPSSHSTIRAAIWLARERLDMLHFLYVFDLQFLARTSQVPPEGLADSMAQMGEFILLMAQDRALEAGVEADAVMRKGEVGEEIVALCNRLDADLVVVGAPLQAKEDAARGNVFTPAALQKLIARIEAETGARVVIVADDEGAAQ